MFSMGDFGQFHLGTETLGGISRSRLHAWFETVAKGDILFVPVVCTLVVDEAGKVWSCGIKDNMALGRPTNHVPDPDNPQEILEAEVLETQLMVVQTLVDENFHTVDVSAGDSMSVALGHKGDLRAWVSGFMPIFIQSVPIFIRPDHPHHPVCPAGPTGPYRPLSYSLHELSYVLFP